MTAMHSAIDSRSLITVASGNELELVSCPVPAALRMLMYRWAGFVDPSTGVYRRELPFLGAPVILTFGAPYLVSDAATPGIAGREVGQFAAGLHRSFSSTLSIGPSWSMQIDLTPIGARIVLGQSMVDLTDRIIPIDSLTGSAGRHLISDLEATTTWAERFALVESFIVRRVAIGPQPDPRIAWALSRLTDTTHRVEVADLAERLGWSHRHLIERFRQEIGLPPKQIARQARFVDAAQRIRQAPFDLPLAAIAADAGYFDQAHLNRDFREFAGMTPSTFRCLGDGQPDRSPVKFRPRRRDVPPLVCVWMAMSLAIDATTRGDRK